MIETYIDENCFEYNGKFYGVGTILKIKNSCGGKIIVKLNRIGNNGTRLYFYGVDFFCNFAAK